MSPLHPLTQECMARVSCSRSLLSQAWNKSIPNARHPFPYTYFGETPLIASRAMMDALDHRLAQLLKDLHPHLKARGSSDWPKISRPDVLAVDIAVVQEENGWGLRFVEFQTFTSVLATAILLRRAHAEVWSELRDLSPFGSHLPSSEDGIVSIGQHICPSSSHSILLESGLSTQPTAFDMEASECLWGCHLSEPSDLLFRNSYVEYEGRQVDHVVNRMIIHTTDIGPVISERFQKVSSVTWHSHPSWYYRLNKKHLTLLSLPASERVVPAPLWEELGLPPEKLVFKACRSYGGVDVLLGPSLDQIRLQPDWSGWICQPRYTPYPLFLAKDGMPVYGEIRLMVALPENGTPWLMTRIVRMSRGEKISVRYLNNTPGSGVTLLYGCPE